MPAPTPARLPLTLSSTLASSTSLRTRRLVCSESCFTSSASDASAWLSSGVAVGRSDICLLLVRGRAGLVGHERRAHQRRAAKQSVAPPPAPAAALFRAFD